MIRHIPLPLTCGVFDGTIITDPSLLEEELLTTNVTVVSTAEGKVRSSSPCLVRNSVCCRALPAAREMLLCFNPLFDAVIASKSPKTVCGRGATWQVCGVHKPGGSCTSGEQLNECLQLCQQHAEALVQTLKAAAVQPRNGDVA